MGWGCPKARDQQPTVKPSDPFLGKNARQNVPESLVLEVGVRLDLGLDRVGHVPTGPVRNPGNAAASHVDKGAQVFLPIPS